jgi:hypothetical protein
MTNVNTTVQEIAPLGGATLGGYKLGWLAVTAKAAQNDTVTITNASLINTAFVQIDATGAAEANTLATNVITCTSSTTGSVRALIIYK